MIDLMQVLKRSNRFWQGLNEEGVKEYKKELTEAKANLEKTTFEQRELLKISSKKIEETVSIIEDELGLCNFYFEYLEKQKEDNFDNWFYVKKEDREKVLDEEWNIKGDCWARYNGKVMTLIAFDTTGMMTKITLYIQNNSDYIEFTHRYGGKEEITSSHLKNQKRIEERVKEYKKKAEEVMGERQYPFYCLELSNMEVLRQLLHVEEEKND